MTGLFFILAFLLSVFTLAYAFFLLRVYGGLTRLGPAHRSSEQRPFVTVLLAARNEEGRIGRCLEFLRAQTYASESYEIIVIDDASTDNTGHIAAEVAQRASNVRLIRMNGGGHKPTALAAGIAEARGEIVLATDADCIVPHGWINSMVMQFDEKIDFVAGPVVERRGQTLISALSRIEFLGLIGVAAGLIGSQTPIFCNGANIAYRKKAFVDAGGFGAGHASDDEALLQRIHHRNPGSVAFSVDPESIVTTDPPMTFSEFWVQRVRWSSKRRVYERKSVLVIPVALYCFFLFYLLTGIACIGTPELLPFLLAVTVIKVALEITVLRTTARLLRQRISWGHVFLAELGHVPYIVFAALQGQAGLFRWKGAPIRS